MCRSRCLPRQNVLLCGLGSCRRKYLWRTQLPEGREHKSASLPIHTALKQWLFLIRTVCFHSRPGEVHSLCWKSRAFPHPLCSHVLLLYFRDCSETLPCSLRLSVLPVLSSHPRQHLCSVPPDRGSSGKGMGKAAGGGLLRAEPKWRLGCQDENQTVRAGCQQTSHTALNASALTCNAPIIPDTHFPGGPRSRPAALHFTVPVVDPPRPV